MTFDPNATGNSNYGLFSLPYSEEESNLIIIPVPWEVTTSYGDGCSLGPDAVYTASKQLDLCDALYGNFYTRGIFQRSTADEVLAQNHDLKKKAQQLRKQLESGESLTEPQRKIQKEINQACEQLQIWVQNQAQDVLDQGKYCGVVGGDHSAPLGLIRALSDKYLDLSILHIDAHMDLRQSYQGYKYSHASIMYNVLQETSIKSLVQLGIRDFCPQEEEISQSDPRVYTFYDSHMSLALSRGESRDSLSLQAINKLTDQVYISLDIDGLSPDLCPNTGTPVPGGLGFSQLEALLYQLSSSKKQIVGFDLCEVSPGPDPKCLESWDANVGARVLFKLAGALLNNN